MLRRLINIALGLAGLTLVCLTIITSIATHQHPLVGDWVRSSTAMTLNPDGTGTTRITVEREFVIPLLWDTQPSNRLLLINGSEERIDPVILEATWQIVGDELQISQPNKATIRWVRWQPAPPLDDPNQIRQALLEHEWHMPWIDDDDSVMTFAADGSVATRCTNDRCTEGTDHWTQEGSRIFVHRRSRADDALPPFELTFSGSNQFIMKNPISPIPLYFRGRPRP